MTQIPDLMVVGTDTNVGKSVVSLLVMQLLYSLGSNPFYIKPFQTGCRDPYDSDSDAAFIYGHTPALQGLDPAQSVIYCHPNPKAPFYAAHDAGERIDLNVVVQQIRRLRETRHPLVIEMAGGLMVPVTEDLMVVDLIERLQCRTLLVGRTGLGTINHTLLSIDALRQRGVRPLGVVFVAGDESDPDVQLAEENMAAVKAFSHVEVAGVIPRIVNFTSPPDRAYTPLRQILIPRQRADSRS